jgi:hypothetical protein
MYHMQLDKHITRQQPDVTNPMSYRTTKFSCILITYKSKNKIGSQNKCSKGEPAMENTINSKLGSL